MLCICHCSALILACVLVLPIFHLSSSDTLKSQGVGKKANEGERLRWRRESLGRGHSQKPSLTFCQPESPKPNNFPE